MLAEIGTGLTYIGGFVLAIYPVFIVVALDILILMAIAKGGGGDHPFVTGMLLGFMFSDRHSYDNSGAASYLTLAILSPITAGMAVYLAFYLGMPLLGWILGLIPAGALVLLGVGVLMQYFGESIENGVGNLAEGTMNLAGNVAEGVVNVAGNTADLAANGVSKLAKGSLDLAKGAAKIPQSLFGYLKDRSFVVSLGVLLLLSASIGSGLLFYFGLTFAAYCLGFSTAGALALLALGYLAKYAYDRRNGKLPPAYDERWDPTAFTQAQSFVYGTVYTSYGAPPAYDAQNHEWQLPYNPQSEAGRASRTPQPEGSVVEVL